VQKAIHDIAASVTTGLNPQQGQKADAAEDPAKKDAVDPADEEAAAAADPADEPAAGDATPATSVTGEDMSAATAGGQDAQPAAVDPATSNDTAADQSAAAASVAVDDSSTATVSHAAGSQSDPVLTQPHPATPVTPVKAPAKAVIDPTLAKLLLPASVVVSTASNLVVTVRGAVVAVPALVASLPNSPTPIADVIAFLLTTVGSVGDSLLPLASLPADVAAAVFALSATGTAPVRTHLASNAHALGNIVLDGPRPAAGPTSGAPVDPPVRNAVTFATGGGFAGPVALAAATRPAAAPVAAPAGASHSMRPYITGALAALLISASLWALFTAALPGLGGLAAFGATGMRIGYRQAKAGIALYRTDLARFAPRGPIGVVRSDAMVSVHRRSADRFMADGSPAERRLRLVDTAA